MPNQQTIASSFTFEGVGIHLGVKARVTVHPADPGAGRLFRVGGVTVPARAEYVLDATRCTTLGLDGARVSTVEHLLSALCALEIDNVVIEVDGPEIPILDGSALPFADAVLEAGIVEQATPATMAAVTERFELVEGSASLTAEPWDVYSLSAATEFDEWPEGAATASVEIGADADEYLKRVAPARTFAFRHEVEMLLAAGLAKGGSLDNALIIDPPDVYSTPLRIPAEWCAHKLLDLIGDLALLDARPAMRILARRPGHRLNTRFAGKLRAIFAAENRGDRPRS